MTSTPPEERVPRPVLVIHGVATRDREGFESEVATLGSALGPDVRLVPIYWGDFAPHEESVDRVLPYREWSGKTLDADDGDESVHQPRLRDAFADQDVTDFLGTIATTWQRRSGQSRRRLLGNLYAVIRAQYLRASAQFTGDLILYHRRQADLQAVIWEAVMRHAPGYGLKEQPIDVIAHSLGGTMVFDMAVSGHPALHIGHLITCASQTAFFHAIGAATTSIGNDRPDDPVTLPSTISSWANLYVPLDPWAFLTAPVFRLHDGSEPEDIEVYGGDRKDRIITHSASHYWTHTVVLDTIRRELDLTAPSDET